MFLYRFSTDLVAPISVSVIGGMETPPVRTITLTLTVPTSYVIFDKRPIEAQPQRTNMPIHYHTNHPITVDQFIALLCASTLGERRPLEDRDCMAAMISNANLTITAWKGERLVGIARSVTDFHYCCYLSDLAVDESYQRQGIGKQLLREMRQQLKPGCKIILLSAPAAVDYYPHLGFERHPQAWVLSGDKEI